MLIPADSKEIPSLNHATVSRSFPIWKSNLPPPLLHRVR